MKLGWLMKEYTVKHTIDIFLIPATSHWKRKNYFPDLMFDLISKLENFNFIMHDKGVLVIKHPLFSCSHFLKNKFIFHYEIHK